MMRMENRMRIGRLVYADGDRLPAPDYRPGRAPSQVVQIAQAARLRADRQRELLDVMPLFKQNPDAHCGLRNVYPLRELGGELKRQIHR